MTTTLVDRPAETRAGDGGIAARRAMIRWGWRLFRREWRQQLLILALLALAVAATILGAGVATNAPPPANEGYGSANFLVTLPGSDPHLSADIAAIKAHFGPVDLIESQALATGTVQGAELVAQDPGGPYGSSMIALVSGAYPTGAGEVAVTSGLASTLNLQVGDVWHETDQDLRVVGLVENPQNLLDEFALVAPGQLSSPNQAKVLFDASSSSFATFTFPRGATPETPPVSIGISPAIIVLVLATFGLLFIALVAVAGFTVMAQRRLRALGMLGALGATDRNIRLVMIANGAVVGVVGALIGSIAGFAAWFAYAPHLQTSAEHRIDPLHLPWWVIGTAMVLAVVAAVAAARWPARAASRIPIVSALSGRPESPKEKHRPLLLSAGLLAIGFFLIAGGAPQPGKGGGSPLQVVLGIVAMTLGGLFLAPVAIVGLARIGRRAPIAVRLALRDLARYRARSGAALGAISLAIIIAVIICVLATARYSNVLDYFGPNLPSNELVVYSPGNGPGGGANGPAVGGPAAHLSLAEMQTRVRALAASLDSRDTLALELAGGTLAQVAHGTTTTNHGNMYVATAALLRFYGISPSAVDPTTLVITSRPGLQGTPGLQLLTGKSESPDCTAGSCGAAPKIQTFDNLPTDTSDPNLLLTSYAVHILGERATPSAWLIRTAHPLTGAQINTAQQAAAFAGMTVETKNEAPSLSTLNGYATGAGILIALAVLTMTVGLIRSETAGDLRILTAAGASSITRRTLTGATAGALAMLGALLGTAVAYLVCLAFIRKSPGVTLANVPALDLIIIIVGLPLVAAVGGWLFAGREPAAIARQPIE
jgi:putative ABC transport system permease protein